MHLLNTGFLPTGGSIMLTNRTHLSHYKTVISAKLRNFYNGKWTIGGSLGDALGHFPALNHAYLMV